MSVSGYSVIVVRVRGCSDSHFLLAEVAGNLQLSSSEVAIANNVSHIRTHLNGEITEPVSTPNILDCASYRTFWIRWDMQGIAVGQGGDAKQGEFMSVEADLHFTQAIGFSTSLHHASVDYELVGIFGN